MGINPLRIWDANKFISPKWNDLELQINKYDILSVTMRPFSNQNVLEAMAAGVAPRTPLFYGSLKRSCVNPVVDSIVRRNHRSN